MLLPTTINTAWQTFPLLVLVALLYSSGGILMKLSEGLTRPLYTLLLTLAVALGVVLQTLVVRHAQPGTTYLLVLGLEAGLALVGSAFIFRENLSFLKLLGLLLIVAGIGCLHARAQ